MHPTSLDYTNRQNAVDLELLKLWRFYLKISEYVCTVCAKAKIEQVYKFEAKNREFVMFLWRILKQFTLQFHLRIGKIQVQDKNMIRLKIIACFQPFLGTQIHVFSGQSFPREAKGQLIPEWNFGVFKSPKLNRTEICLKFGWLFGRFEDTKNSFWDYLTFSVQSITKFYKLN